MRHSEKGYSHEAEGMERTESPVRFNISQKRGNIVEDMKAKDDAKLISEKAKHYSEQGFN